LPWYNGRVGSFDAVVRTDNAWRPSSPTLRSGWTQDESARPFESVFRIVKDPFRGAIEEPIKTVLAELQPVEDFP
jgi:hypothetical protein